jgi:hypothetical protein
MAEAILKLTAVSASANALAHGYSSENAFHPGINRALGALQDARSHLVRAIGVEGPMEIALENIDRLMAYLRSV